jgi:D-lactate dehydrogenase (cytochrome)
VHRIPSNTAMALVSFKDVRSAAEVAAQVMERDERPGMVELMDAAMIRAINRRYVDMRLDEAPTLLIEFLGSGPGELDQQRRVLEKLCRARGGGELRFAATAAEREKIWRVRKQAFFACQTLRSDEPHEGEWDVLTTDVCVPPSRLAQCVADTHDDLSQSFLPAPLVGHVGDGNFHLLVVFRRSDPRELAEAERISDALVRRALAAGGTCTGEHGVGLGKIKYMRAEHGDAVDVMRAIKQAIDPENLMNPGKMLPE